MHNDYKIRKAESSDLLKIARVHVDCWRTTYKGIVPNEILDRMSYEKSAEKWSGFFSGAAEGAARIFLLDHKSDTVGFCAGGQIRKSSKRTEGYFGEIKAVYILDGHQRKGYGTEFVRTIEEIFIKYGIFSYIIWVLKESSSKEFYKKLGGKLLTTKTYKIGEKKLKGLCFGYKIVSSGGL